MIYRSDSFIAF